jgi:ribose 5-phosphate isomerase A
MRYTYDPARDVFSKSISGSEEEKRLAGESAASMVSEGNIVGLGTGSTALYAIQALGEAVKQGLEIQGVSTSFQSSQLAEEVGIPLVKLSGVDRIDIAIDGADQVAGFNLVKGGGAAHTREKIVASAADKFIVAVDSSKVSKVLNKTVPVEVLFSARTIVSSMIKDMGGNPELRYSVRKDGPVSTENGNIILDCDFGDIESPLLLSKEISEIPGVVDHGLFVNMASEIHIGRGSSVEIQKE